MQLAAEKVRWVHFGSKTSLAEDQRPIRVAHFDILRACAQWTHEYTGAIDETNQTSPWYFQRRLWPMGVLIRTNILAAICYVYAPKADYK